MRPGEPRILAHSGRRVSTARNLVVAFAIAICTGPSAAALAQSSAATVLQEEETATKKDEGEVAMGAAADAAKQAQNPLANMITLPLQWNTSFGIGEHDRTGATLNIQPIIPLGLSKDWILINRIIAPLPKVAPDAGLESGGTSGLGDITLMNWFSPPSKGAFTWGVGPVTVWPTATDDALGSGKFSIGPSAVLVYMKPKWVAAAVINAWWSVAGDSDRPDVATFYFQPIVSYFLPQKWYLTSAPVLLADLQADAGQRWTVPLGGGIGKMFNLGERPMDAQVQYFRYVVAPDGGPTWELRLQLKFIFPQGR